MEAEDYNRERFSVEADQINMAAASVHIRGMLYPFWIFPGKSFGTLLVRQINAEILRCVTKA